MIKNVWVSGERDCYTLSIRETPDTNVPLYYHSTLMPPVEKVGNKKLSLAEAQEKRLQEWSSTLGTLTEDDLWEIHDAIERFIEGQD